MDPTLVRTHLTHPRLAPIVITVDGGRLGPDALQHITEYMALVEKGERPMALLIEADQLINSGTKRPRVRLWQLCYDLAPVRVFLDDGTPEALVDNCAQAAHEATRRAGDKAPAWDDLTAETRAEVVGLTRDILEGNLAAQQRAMRAARGPFLEGTPEEAEVPITDRHRLSMLFYGVVELMRCELDWIRSRAAQRPEAASAP